MDEKRYAVLDGNCFIPDNGPQIFSQAEARELLRQYRAAHPGSPARLVELQPSPTLFEFAATRLLHAGGYVSNGFALTRIEQADLGENALMAKLVRILLEGLPSADRLIHVACCPPDYAISPGSPMQVYAPAGLAEPYRPQADRLICASEHFLYEAHWDWEDCPLYAVLHPTLPDTPVIVIIDGGQMAGAVMPLRVEPDKLDRLREQIDWAKGGRQDW